MHTCITIDCCILQFFRVWQICMLLWSTNSVFSFRSFCCCCFAFITVIFWRWLNCEYLQIVETSEFITHRSLESNLLLFIKLWVWCLYFRKTKKAFYFRTAEHWKSMQKKLNCVCHSIIVFITNAWWHVWDWRRGAKVHHLYFYKNITT